MDDPDVHLQDSNGFYHCMAASEVEKGHHSWACWCGPRIVWQFCPSGCHSTKWVIHAREETSGSP